MIKAGIVCQSTHSVRPRPSKGLRHRAVGLARKASTCVAAACLMLSSVESGAQPAEGPQRLRTTTLGAGMHNIVAEVALTPQEHATGLMHRTSMGTHEGMLFIFDRPGTQCFWMKNTLIPLSIAFISDDGTIVNVDEMKPQTLASHCSAQPVRHVLEMNAGWFKKRGLGAGSKLTGAPFGTPR